MEPLQAEPASAAPQPPAAGESRLTRGADAAIRWFARHWLALFNTAWGLYVFLPILAALFMYVGLEPPARAIYTLYSFLCHQLPSHSYFLFGHNHAPDTASLVAAGMANTPDLFVQRKFVGNEIAGYKVALCQRDVAIYLSVFVSGLIFSGVRARVKPLKVRWVILAMIPMAIDGGTQLFGWRESNWILRSITGALFGAAAVWWAYPYINEAMDDVLSEPALKSPAEPTRT